ncbi:MAG: DNA translocase FtsK [Pseudomonadota bacterium]
MQISELEQRRLNPTVKEGLGSQFSVITGLGVLAAVGLAFASLATWNVADPSFSHASSNDVHNLMGYPGAVFADFTMQLTGLAAAVALIPPALWGWSKLLQKNISFMKTRSVFWMLSIFFSTIFFACFTTPQNWPLPLGLGGYSGDIALKIPAMFAGEMTGYKAVLTAAVAFIPATWFLLAASALTWRHDSAIYAEQNAQELAEEFSEDEESQPNWLLGAISHYFFVFKMRHAQRKKAKMEAAALLDEPKPSLFRKFLTKAGSIKEKLLNPDDGLDDFSYQNHDPAAEYGAYAPEPQMHPEMNDSGFQSPDYGENVYDHYEEVATIEDEWAPRAAPTAENPMQPAPTPIETESRVQPMAPPPAPSKRVQREAQPSLINTSDFELPPLHFMQDVPPSNQSKQLSNDALEQNARMLEGVLTDFGIKGEIINVRPGPVVTLYELEPAPGIKSSRVIGLADDIARSMSAIAARVAVVPGRNVIGIELPNANRETVYMSEILSCNAYEKSKAKVPIILGKTIGGEPTIADLAKMPHLLVAGTTGSGKSVAINTMILSILYRFGPDQVKMIMIDPKMLELSIYDGIPHLLTPVVTDPKKAVVALKWSVREMEERYKKMSKIGVRNIDGYNARVKQAQKSGERMTRTIQTGYDRDTGEAIYETEELQMEPMPYIVVIIDEMADLMMVAGKDIEGTVQRLAQMARAAGIHVIMATQRPSTDVITGTIKANFPTRISFQVTSKIDSRVMLGESGAEQLLGMGDMLYMAGGGRIQRVHGPFVADEEVDKVVNHLKEQGVPQYLDSVTEEDEEEASSAGGGGGETGGLADSNDIYDRAVAIVLNDRKVSTSYVQRRLSIGYNRAASLIERMEQEGLISPANHAGKREILVPDPNETI